MADGFKPNIYPIIWWALAYGLVAGVILWLVSILSRFITIVWFPVFLAGLLFGAWRNYKKQKDVFYTAGGLAPTPLSPLAEFKEAVADIAEASQELLQQEETQPVEDGEPATSAPAETQAPEKFQDDSEQTPPTPPAAASPPPGQ